MAVSSSPVYLSRTRRSIASEETVRIPIIVSDAMALLVENLLFALLSMCASSRMRAYPANSMGGRPAKTPTRPSFHDTAMAMMLLARMLSAHITIIATVNPISSRIAIGYESRRPFNAPTVFSGRSKKRRSCFKRLPSISSLDLTLSV